MHSLPFRFLTERAAELFEEADLYGDWVQSQGSKSDAIRTTWSSAHQDGEAYEALSPRAFQLLHDRVTSEVGLTTFDL